MKAVLIIILLTISVSSYSQVKKTVSKKHHNKTSLKKSATSGTSQTGVIEEDRQPRQTITERYLNGPVRKGQSAATSDSSGTLGKASPFVDGVHAAENATKTFDTVSTNRNTANNQTVNTTIAAGNDTTFNANTVLPGGVTTNSGAVDRSGQAQFGQTNWGNSRSTVGESQWTVPPPITASFSKEFPTSNNATWTRNNVDTTIYFARYKTGDQWVTTRYNATGQRLDMRTEFPLLQSPRAVNMFMAKQPTGFQAETIYQLQVQGKPDIYEIRLKTGKTIYVDSEGIEVNY